MARKRANSWAMNAYFKGIQATSLGRYLFPSGFTVTTTLCHMHNCFTSPNNCQAKVNFPQAGRILSKANSVIHLSWGSPKDDDTYPFGVEYA